MANLSVWLCVQKVVQQGDIYLPLCIHNRLMDLEIRVIQKAVSPGVGHRSKRNRQIRECRFFLFIQHGLP